jgi:hypothetical protein
MGVPGDVGGVLLAVLAEPDAQAVAASKATIAPRLPRPFAPTDLTRFGGATRVPEASILSTDRARGSLLNAHPLKSNSASVSGHDATRWD